MRRFTSNLSSGYKEFSQSANKEGFAEQKAQELQAQYDSQSKVLTLEQSNRMMQKIDSSYVPLSEDEQEERRELGEQVFASTKKYIQETLASAEKDPFGDKHGERAIARFFVNRNPSGGNETYQQIYLKAQGTGAEAEEYKKKLGAIWLGTVNAALETYGESINNPAKKDEDLAGSLDGKLNAAFLFLNGLNYLKDYAEFARNDTNTAAINDLIERATKAHDNAAKFLMRVNRIADPLYSVIDFEQMQNFPYSTLQKLIPDNENPGVLAEDAGVQNTNDFKEALNYFYQAEAGDRRTQQRRSMKKALCKHFKVKSLQELLTSHALLDFDGNTTEIDVAQIIAEAKAKNTIAEGGKKKTSEQLDEHIEDILANTIIDKLAYGSVMYLASKNGKTEPVPLCAESNGSLKSFYLGQDELRNREDPLPSGPAPLLPWRWMVMTLLAIPEFLYWLATGKDIPYYAARNDAAEDLRKSTLHLNQKNAAIDGTPAKVQIAHEKIALNTQIKELETRLPKDSALKDQAIEILKTGTAEMKETLMSLDSETLKGLAGQELNLENHLKSMMQPQRENAGPQDNPNAQPAPEQKSAEEQLVNNEPKPEVKEQLVNNEPKSEVNEQPEAKKEPVQKEPTVEQPKNAPTAKEAERNAAIRVLEHYVKTNLQNDPQKKNELAGAGYVKSFLLNNDNLKTDAAKKLMDSLALEAKSVTDGTPMSAERIQQYSTLFNTIQSIYAEDKRNMGNVASPDGAVMQSARKLLTTKAEKEAVEKAYKKGQPLDNNHQVKWSMRLLKSEENSKSEQQMGGPGSK